METQDGLYKTLALPVVINVSETWIFPKAIIKYNGLWNNIPQENWRICDRGWNRKQKHENRVECETSRRESALISDELGRAPDQSGYKPTTNNVNRFELRDTEVWDVHWMFGQAEQVQWPRGPIFQLKDDKVDRYLRYNCCCF